jgi:hypothetical protein
MSLDQQWRQVRELDNATFYHDIHRLAEKLGVDAATLVKFRDAEQRAKDRLYVTDISQPQNPVVPSVSAPVPTRTRTIGSESAQPYVYSPLYGDDGGGIAFETPFRILRLFSGDETAPLVGEIVEHSLDAAVNFEAVSYRWDDPPEDSDLRNEPQIRIETQFHRISWALRKALVAFRHANKTRNLWIDQICINQSLPSEKDRQVLNMGKIYGKAFQTLIWINPFSSHLISAMETIREYGNERQNVERLTEKAILAKAEKLEPSGPGRVLLSHPKNKEQRARIQKFKTSPVVRAGIMLEELKKVSFPKLDKNKLEQVLDFFNCPWFTRTWPVQEVVLSGVKIAHCGKTTIDFKDVAFFAEVLMHNLHRYRVIKARTQGLSAANHVQYFVKTYECGFSLLSLLRTMRQLEAGDPRDKVNAVLHMVDFNLDSKGDPYDSTLEGRAPIPRSLEPCYDPKVTEMHVYQNAAEFLIKRDRGLDVLMYVQHISTYSSTPLVPTRPTWVPRWDQREEMQPICFPEESSTNFSSCTIQYQAPEFKPIIRHETSTYDTCTVHGNEMGTIQSCYTVWYFNPRSESPGLNFVSILQWIDGLVKEDLEKQKSKTLFFKKKVTDTLIDQLSVTLTAGRDSNGGLLPLGPATFESAARERHRGLFVTWFLKIDLYTEMLDDWEKLPDYEGALHLQKQIKADKRYRLAREQDKGFEYLQLLAAACRNRRVFRLTNGGMIGLGPSSLERQDLVCILKGAKVPFILRRAKQSRCVSREDTYELIGPCFVYGAMNQELEWKAAGRTNPYVLE